LGGEASTAHLILPTLVAFASGMMNSVAGGGSFLSFPALVFAGVPPISANATNNAAMWVGTIGSARGYREEIREHRSLLRAIAIASALGALLGAILLLATPQTTFVRLIPWLLLFATIVFAASPLLARPRQGPPRPAGDLSRNRRGDRGDDDRRFLHAGRLRRVPFLRHEAQKLTCCPLRLGVGRPLTRASIVRRDE
jgi:uncharacterized membrane protein YfcA